MQLNKDDYEEQRCLLNMHPEIVRIPTNRIMDKLDSLLEKKDFDGAERLLDNWVSEADTGNDRQGKLTMLNEKIGLFRKISKEEKCLHAIDSALSLVEELEFTDKVTGATTFINAATCYKAFGMADKAFPLYTKAKKIYEELLKPDDDRLAALYNNMALTLVELKEYDEAEKLYKKALEILNQQKRPELEMAITYLNMADMMTAKLGPVDAEKYVNDYLDRAEKLLDTEDLPRDGYYAFVCEKCAPVFGYYGYFATKKKLEERQ